MFTSQSNSTSSFAAFVLASRTATCSGARPLESLALSWQPQSTRYLIISSLYCYFRAWKVVMPKFVIPGDLVCESLSSVSSESSVGNQPKEENIHPSEFSIESKKSCRNPRSWHVQDVYLKLHGKLQQLLLLPGPAIFISGIAGNRLTGHPKLKRVREIFKAESCCTGVLHCMFSVAASLGMGKIMYVCLCQCKIQRNQILQIQSIPQCPESICQKTYFFASGGCRAQKYGCCRRMCYFGHTC